MALIVGAIAIGKTGVLTQVMVWRNEQGLIPEESGEPLSYGFRIVGFVFGFTTRGPYLGVAIVTTFLAIGALAVAARSAGDRKAAKLTVLIVASGPLVWSMAQGLGRPDSLLIAGAALLVSRPRPGPIAAVGGLLMVLAHPEQAAFAVGALLLLSMGRRFRQWRRLAAWSTAFALIYNVLLQIWATQVEASTRADVFESLLVESLGRFVMFLPLELWAGLGIVGIITVFAIARESAQSTRFALVAGVLIIPLIVTAATLDQSRVFVGVTACTSIVVAKTYSSVILNKLTIVTKTPLAFAFVLTTLLPAVFINFMGEVSPPWSALYVELLRLIPQ